jgi:hyperosmotically inducible protein
MKAIRASILALAILGAVPAAAQPERKEGQVARDVTGQVNRYPNFTVFDDVNVSVREGKVTLTGKVTMPHKRGDLERRISRVQGVAQVDNRLEVLPVSTADDNLRYRLARAIYSHPTFWKYAAMSNPPIHIVVDGGRVTLTGVVHTELERALARSIASTVFGVFSLDNRLKTDVEAREQLDRPPARDR